ncbi:NADP-dependent malic enzyme [Rossellomorea aquimaris]|jgi:malate dehydrogenase (oxaloacetate-decarboxylating)|uniref:NADP-dependent malic enzyme n=1 Tax=Rossellomorea aquimaris TaxID=189382 RepID=A0A5D4TYN9_9BACI|nr:NADP-dependent malic enzyme [Rossellomorea aquimaris]TYS80137.1 NADP-dependent malic enzyme [Rossellomorea aquimaris]TYS85520.1 NADP-dependent malic enzyme [Rossellomorea aquimaris]
MTRKNLKEEAISIHASHAGKIEVVSKIDISSEEDLSLVYTPGVADVCNTIAEDPLQANTLTSKGNMVAIVTDGTAVLGLGDIGPEAAIPVMEGKSMLFKKFAGIDAFPLSLDTKDVDEIVTIIKAMSPSFGGINLEDISAPRCFEIENRLKKELDIPVFHDDQHGTAIVVLGALVNALKVVNKSYKKVKIVINGAGAAGIAIAELLLFAGYEDITLVSLEGVLCKGEKWMNATQEDITLRTNLLGVRGELSDAIKGADVFIGVSGPGALKKEYIKMMNEQPIVFAMANPIPEIYPEEALEAGASIVGTGRSDYPNQVNNLLAFPGIFRGALDAKAKDITMEMKVAASYAIADVVSSSELNPQYIIPNALDPRVAEKVGESVRKIACKKSKANSSVS